MHECKATIAVTLTPDQDGVKETTVVVLPCTLLKPHAGYRHMNPRIQRTLGGERRTDDSNWSYFVEKLQVGFVKVTYQSTDGGRGQLTIPTASQKEIEKMFWPHKVSRIEKQ